MTTAASLAGLLPPRPHESNKGMYGRVGILAGSVGATGAAVMCAHACARSGAGLITLLAHPDIYPIVAAAASAEVMVKPLASPTDALDMDFDVLALGPGLGQQSADRVRALIATLAEADGHRCRRPQRAFRRRGPAQGRGGSAAAHAASRAR